MATIIKSVALFCKNATSDKEYNATLEESGGGYVVNFSYGRRGNATSTGTRTSSPVSLAEAEKAYDKLVAEKMGKGYLPNGDANLLSVTGNSSATQTGLFPQLLNPVTEEEAEQYIIDDLYMAQEKLDGKRIMATSNLEGVVTSNRKGITCGVPKEIEEGISKWRGTTLDGEMIGSTYWVFDLLRLGGVDWTRQAAMSRYHMLKTMMEKIKPQNMSLVRCAFTEAEKRQLIKDLAHKEGVVFKHVMSPYTPGRPNSGGTQYKCKFWADVTAQVMVVNAQRSVQVGVMKNGVLVNVGNVTVPPNYTMPDVGDIVEIKYLYFVSKLYQPQYKGIRDDHDVDDYAVLKHKSNDTDED